MARVHPVLFLGLIFALLFVSVRNLKGDTKGEDAAKRDIQRVLDDQVTAWNKGDLERFMAGYWKSDELTFYSGGDKTFGWQATFDRYKKRYQSEGREMGTLAFRELQIEPLGPDSAVVRGRWRLVFVKPEGWFGRLSSIRGGLFTLIFKKKPQGWCIVHDHTS
jgi:beta-aspartyl-peptidase (threonine type)